MLTLRAAASDESCQHNSTAVVTLRVGTRTLVVPAKRPPNKRLQRTGISEPLIEDLPLAQLRPGR